MVGVPRSSVAPFFSRLLTVFPMVVVAAVIATPRAMAAAPTFPDACAGSNNLDPATCERVDFLANTAADDAERLDLIWWGIAGILGMQFVLVIAPMFVSSFRFLKE